MCFIKHFKPRKNLLCYFEAYLYGHSKDNVLRYVLENSNCIIYVEKFMKKNYFVVSIKQNANKIQIINFQYFIYYWLSSVIKPKTFVVIQTLYLYFLYEFLLRNRKKTFKKSTSLVYLSTLFRQKYSFRFRFRQSLICTISLSNLK